MILYLAHTFPPSRMPASVEFSIKLVVCILSTDLAVLAASLGELTSGELTNVSLLLLKTLVAVREAYSA